jgi:hypothetical protein
MNNVERDYPKPSQPIPNHYPPHNLTFHLFHPWDLRPHWVVHPPSHVRLRNSLNLKRGSLLSLVHLSSSSHVIIGVFLTRSSTLLPQPSRFCFGSCAFPLEEMETSKKMMEGCFQTKRGPSSWPMRLLHVTTSPHNSSHIPNSPPSCCHFTSQLIPHTKLTSTLKAHAFLD